MNTYNQQAPRSKPKLREQAINPNDLVEVDAKQYTEMKMQGISGQAMQRNLKSQPQVDSINFNISFIPPKKENFAKTGVFLPMKNQKYGDLRNNVSTLLKKHIPVRYSYTPVSQGNNVVYGQQYGQPVVVSRVIHKADGNVVSMPVNRY